MNTVENAPYEVDAQAAPAEASREGWVPLRVVSRSASPSTHSFVVPFRPGGHRDVPAHPKHNPGRHTGNPLPCGRGALTPRPLAFAADKPLRKRSPSRSGLRPDPPMQPRGVRACPPWWAPRPHQRKKIRIRCSRRVRRFLCSETEMRRIGFERLPLLALLSYAAWSKWPGLAVCHSFVVRWNVVAGPSPCRSRQPPSSILPRSRRPCRSLTASRTQYSGSRMDSPGLGSFVAEVAQ
jgi:hypothetical protein